MTNDKNKDMQAKKVDTREFELPETLFIRDIDDKVFQGIVLECINQITGVTLIESTFIDSIFGRSTTEGARGIQAEQDNKNHSVAIKIEVNILYGISIPEKAEEIQTLVAEKVTELTGIHVSSVHVIFKSLLLSDAKKGGYQEVPPTDVGITHEDYSEEF